MKSRRMRVSQRCMWGLQGLIKIYCIRMPTAGLLRPMLLEDDYADKLRVRGSLRS